LRDRGALFSQKMRQCRFVPQPEWQNRQAWVIVERPLTLHQVTVMSYFEGTHCMHAHAQMCICDCECLCVVPVLDFAHPSTWFMPRLCFRSCPVRPACCLPACMYARASMRHHTGIERGKALNAEEKFVAPVVVLGKPEMPDVKRLLPAVDPDLNFSSESEASEPEDGTYCAGLHCDSAAQRR
jgi:hypothetical protein